MKTSSQDILMSANPVLKAFLAGSLSGTASTILFQPLDLIKTRMQTSSSSTSSGTMFGEARAVMSSSSSGGVTGLWRGLIPSLLRTVPGVGLYFSSMHWMRNTVCGGRPTTFQSVAIGGLARTVAGSIMIPFTVVKIRMECGTYSGYSSVAAALSSIFKSEGARGLVKGLAPTLIRDVPFSGLYLGFYEMLKRDVQPAWASPEVGHMLAGLGAGVLASLVTQPADVIKTKMQVGKNQSGSIPGTVAMIYRETGLKGFATGIAPRMLRRTVMAALAWTVYEKALTSLKLK